MKVKITILVILLAFAGSVFAKEEHPAIDPIKEKNIRELLKTLGVVDLCQQVMDQMLTNFSQSYSTVPPEFWTEMKRTMDANELVDLIVPLYDRYYTNEDIEGLLAFYRSPLGKKVVSTLPEITKESMSVGQEWGKKKALEVQEQLKSKGLLK